MGTMIEVLSPLGRRRQTTLQRPKALASLAGTTVGLLAPENKPHAAEFLELVGEGLVAGHGVGRLMVATKSGSSRPAEPEVLEGLKSVDLAITAFAD